MNENSCKYSSRAYRQQKAVCPWKLLCYLLVSFNKFLKYCRRFGSCSIILRCKVLIILALHNAFQLAVHNWFHCIIGNIRKVSVIKFNCPIICRSNIFLLSVAVHNRRNLFSCDALVGYKFCFGIAFDYSVLLSPNNCFCIISVRSYAIAYIFHFNKSPYAAQPRRRIF